MITRHRCCAGTAHAAHAALAVNPRAFGREIDDSTIAALRRPASLWLAGSVFVVSSGIGILLAAQLAGAAVTLRDPDLSRRRLENYARWKPFGTCLTFVAFVWFAVAQQSFWNAATRHVPIGSGPPVLSAAVLAACATLPLRWVRKRTSVGSSDLAATPVERCAAPAPRRHEVSARPDGSRGRASLRRCSSHILRVFTRASLSQPINRHVP